MIELARCSKLDHILISGPNSARRMFALHRLGFNRVATTGSCGLPSNQYDVAWLECCSCAIKSFETTLDWIVHFLTGTGVAVVWIDSCDSQEQRKLVSILAKAGLRVEAATRCDKGLALSARHDESRDIAKAA
jgi:hypothetical protein